MNLPNKLTILRIILVPIFMAALLISSIPYNYLIALIVFVLASFTDMMDGKIARKYNLVTDFGKFADPLADKILVMAAFVCFVELGLASSVVVMLILFREFAVTSIRLIAAAKGRVVAANIFGKAKTVSQMVAITTVLAFQYILQLQSVYTSSNFSDLYSIFGTIGSVLIWLSAILAIVSGVIYIVQNREFIKEAE